MTALLEVLTCLAFVFGLFSVLVSAATELFMAFVAQRGRTLWRAVQGLLPGGGEVARAFMSHPLVRGMGAAEHDMEKQGMFDRALTAMRTGQGGEGKRVSFPSYLSPTMFADTLTHLLRSGSLRHGHVIRESDTAALIGDVKNDQMRATLQALHDGAVDQGVPFQAKLQQWFNDGMDRATGTYKRNSQVVLFAVGLVMAVGCNVDTITIVRTLASNGELRQELAAKAADYAEKQIATAPPPEPVVNGKALTGEQIVQAKLERYNAALANMHSLGVPIGWVEKDGKLQLKNPVTSIAGWILSALAATLGANFWFQVLGNLLKMRLSGAKPEPPPAQNFVPSSPNLPSYIIGPAVPEPGTGLEPEPADASPKTT